MSTGHKAVIDRGVSGSIGSAIANVGRKRGHNVVCIAYTPGRLRTTAKVVHPDRGTRPFRCNTSSMRSCTCPIPNL
jgi:short-subunit dehydrogenase